MENKPNQGSLWINDKGDNPNRPDRTGSINIDGVDYWLSGWIKTSPTGKTYMSLSAKPKDPAGTQRTPVAAQMNQQARQSQQAPPQRQQEDDFDAF